MSLQHLESIYDNIIRGENLKKIVFILVAIQLCDVNKRQFVYFRLSGKQWCCLRALSRSIHCVVALGVNPWMDWVTFTRFLKRRGRPVYCPPTFRGRLFVLMHAVFIGWLEQFSAKFSQLILMKIIKIVATRCQILRLKYTKFNFGWGSTPDPAGRAYSAPSAIPLW